MTDETVTVRLETDDTSDTLEVPVALIEMLAEADDSVSSVVGDLAMLGLAQQAHGVVHHSQGDVGDDVEAAEALTMDLFEERFGQTYGEMTGHSH
ncbi:MAG: hypothetical protein ACI8XM_002575 [Haloarculaceae archaeon]|jgi:hypothetical protein